MLKSALLISALFIAQTLVHPASAESSCKSIQEFEGLVFDAGAFVASSNMEGYLDSALMNGVEKVVLFPHPTAKSGNRPNEVESVFPDLVLQGARPWSKVTPIVWPEPMQSWEIGRLGEELQNHPERQFLLPHISRFDLDILDRVATQNPNLWLGFSPYEINKLAKNCASGPLRHLLTRHADRVVFASMGLDRGWRNYKATIRNLKRVASYLPEESANALLFRNAEELYGLAVNAP